MVCPQGKRKRANNIQLKPIEEIARSIRIKKKFLKTYGPYIAKISPDAVRPSSKKRGKYIAVTSITPTPFGEGKTVTTLGLSMAFNRLKKKCVACIPQPSLAGLLGTKGPGTGGGFAQALPAEDANLHLTGDTYAVIAAHNLCAAYIDNLLFRDNALDVAVESISWRRVSDINDRALRNVNIGLGSKTDGVPRKSGFDTIGASEIMSIVGLANDMKDLRDRVGKVIVAFTKKGKPVTSEDLKIAGAMTALLKNAIMPNLLQTSEHTPCFVHGASRGDLALGGTSVIADKIALSCADYAVTETGFTVETGAEKFFDIKCRASGIKPDAVVIVCTTRALKMHSGDYEVSGSKLPKDIYRENVSAVERGLSNLEKQIENLQVFGVPIVIAINRFTDDTEKELSAIKKRAINRGVNNIAVSNAWSQGGEGAVELARTVAEACKTKTGFRFLYPVDISIKEKVARITKTIYGAKEVVFSEDADKTALFLKKAKLDAFPVCIAKTHLSLSHSPKRKARPHGFKFPVDDFTLESGAGYIMAFSNNIKTMPGLPKVPRATKTDLGEDLKVTGLF